MEAWLEITVRGIFHSESHLSHTVHLRVCASTYMHPGFTRLQLIETD